MDGPNAWVKDKIEHCFDCGVCVLKLDHHCAFFDACIGKGNMHLFICVIFGFFALLILTAILSMYGSFT